MSNLIHCRFASAVLHSLISNSNGLAIVEDLKLTNDGHEYEGHFFVPIDKHADFVVCLNSHEASIENIDQSIRATPAVATYIKKRNGKTKKPAAAFETVTEQLKALLSDWVSIKQLQASTGWTTQQIQGRMSGFRKTKQLKIKKSPKGKLYRVA